MNTTDLRQVLDERSNDSAEQVMHHLRLRGVRAKVRRRRRQRAATWAACVLVALAGIAVATIVPRPAPQPAAAPSFFPEYAEGAQVVAAATTDLPARSVEVTLVPTTLDLVVFERCEVPLHVRVTLGGRELMAGSCGGSGRWSKWPGYDLAVGRPASFVITVTGSAPATGRFGLAIGERVPFLEYKFPPRPAVLEPLTSTNVGGCVGAGCPAPLILRSDPDDPTRPVGHKLEWKTLEGIDMVAQTPGLLHVQVAGVEVATGEWWDYRQGGYGQSGDASGQWKVLYRLDPRPGEVVTVKVVPEHMTGAWQVVLRPDV